MSLRRVFASCAQGPNTGHTKKVGLSVEGRKIYPNLTRDPLLEYIKNYHTKVNYKLIKDKPIK